ncbi:hypothetical protein [Actinocorallia populi]|uniref:hypothetical protein n=1 Tax=Actinocorallia populi TaxID=2079200 RepID=UPI00130045C9|nr:hypothetical protein [Actinocorallia populi]
MRVRKGLARRVRRGPTLLLPEVPQRLLETVRLFAPEARQEEGVVVAGSALLEGPFEVTSRLARLAELPEGWAVAYVGEGPDGLVAGLARRLGGLWFQNGRPVAYRDDEDQTVTVYLPRRPDPERLTSLVENTTYTATPDTDLYSGGLVSLLVQKVHEHHVTCDLHSADAHRLGHTALAIAREFGGVALDGDGYRITAPEDLKPVPRQRGRASEH